MTRMGNIQQNFSSECLTFWLQNATTASDSKNVKIGKQLNCKHLLAKKERTNQENYKIVPIYNFMSTTTTSMVCSYL